MSYIEFGLPTKSLKFWLLQLFPLFIFFRELCQEEMVKQIKASGDNTEINYLGFCVFMFIGEMCAGFILLARHLYEKKESAFLAQKPKPISKLKSKKITVIKATTTQTKWGLIFFVLGLLTLIDGGAFTFLETAFEYDKDNFSFQLQAIELIFCGIFSRILFKVLLYKHQLMSISIVCLGIIPLCLIETTPNKFGIWTTIGIYFGGFTFYGLQDSVFKWLLDDKFVQPETILFFDGIFGIVISIILGSIEFGFGLKLRAGEKYLTCFEVIKQCFNKWTGGFLFFGVIVFTLAYNYMILLITKYYSPTQKIISDLVFGLILLIRDKIKKENVVYWEWILLVLGFCLTSIGCLIYDEIVILNFCGLGLNTKQNIEQRSKEEAEKLCNEPLESSDETELEIESLIHILP